MRLALWLPSLSYAEKLMEINLVLFHPLRDHCYIAIEWELSKLSAFLCCLQPEQGIEIIKEHCELGLALGEHEFAQTFLRVTEPWIEEYGSLPVYINGQIASSAGWRESPYIPCPISSVDLIDAKLTFEYRGETINMLPGISCAHKNEQVDEMRTETLQVLGWLEASATHRNGTFLVCLPGKQSKWVLVKEGVIRSFTCSNTSEIFDLICQHEAETDQIAALIAHDVKKTLQSKEWDIVEVDELIIIGESHISELYKLVISKHSAAVRCFHGKQATVNGFAAIRKRDLASNI